MVGKTFSLETDCLSLSCMAALRTCITLGNRFTILDLCCFMYKISDNPILLCCSLSLTLSHLPSFLEDFSSWLYLTLSLSDLICSYYSSNILITKFSEFLFSSGHVLYKTSATYSHGWILDLVTANKQSL